MQAEVLYGVLGASRPPERSRGGRRGDARLQRVARRLLRDASRALRRAGVDPEQPDRGGDRRGGARGQARRAARARHRQLAGPEAAVGSLLESALGGGERSGLPLHFHTVGGYVPEHIRKIDADRLRSHAGQRARRARGRPAGGAGGVRRQHHRVPDQHGEHADVHDLQRRARALSRASGWCSASRGSAGFPTSSGAWTPSGRTSSRTCRSRCRRASTGSASAGPRIRPIPSASSCSTSWAPTRSCGARTSRIPTACGRTRASTSSGAGHLPAAMRRKIVCENAAHLYGFPLA